jgi:hypothetical protein
MQRQVLVCNILLFYNSLLFTDYLINYGDEHSPTLYHCCVVFSYCCFLQCDTAQSGVFTDVSVGPVSIIRIYLICRYSDAVKRQYTYTKLHGFKSQKIVICEYYCEHCC